MWEKKIASYNFLFSFWCDDISRGLIYRESTACCVIHPDGSAKKNAGEAREREATKRVYLRVAFGFGILWCALFFSFNIIIPPHGKANAPYTHNTQQLIPNFSLIVVFCWCFSLSLSLSPLSPLTISAVFISILLPFNQLLILFFLPFFLFASFFFGAKSFTNFYSLFIRVRTTTAKSCCCSRAACFAGVL